MPNDQLNGKWYFQGLLLFYYCWNSPKNKKIYYKKYLIFFYYYIFTKLFILYILLIDLNNINFGVW